MPASARFGDYFGVGPDINITSLKSVYPTARGGTSGSAAGAMTGDTNFGASNSANAGATPGMSNAPFSTSGRSLGWWLGIVALLAVLVFVARKAGSDEDFRNIKPTAYNFLAITLTAIVGIVGLKVIFAKYRVPGFSDVILAT